MSKLSFSGHDSFECRHFWLKKGFDHVASGGRFNDEAVVSLGVGRNMVNAIRHWMRAFGLLDSEDKLTDFSQMLFGKNGFDPYLEDEASLWLLHFNLVTNEYASLFSLVFNELRKQKPEFTKEHITRFVLSKFPTINEATVGKDFEVFTKTYVTKGSDAEENYDGVLAELNLIQEIKKERKSYFVIKTEDRENIPIEIILYCLLQNNTRNSIDFESLMFDKNNVGTVFAFTKQGLANKLEELGRIFKKESIVFSDHAGIKELQFRKKLPAPKEFLMKYYHEVYAG